MSEDEIVVGDFLKNNLERVCGTISPYNNRLYAHIRVFVPSASQEGEWIRTQRGIGVEISTYHRVHSAILLLGDVAGKEKVVAKIPISNNNEIWIGINEFKGNLYCYLRVHFESSGKWLPTKKGITIPTHLLPELEKLSSRIVERIPRAGH